MQKAEYLTLLESSLTGMNPAERKEILADYAEHFDMGILSGRTEEEIALALGEPRNIGREYSAVNLVKQAEESPSAGGLGRAVIATIGLGLFNLIVVLIPFIVIIILLAVLLVIGFALLSSGPILTGFAVLEILGIISDTLPLSAFASVFFGIGLTCFGLFILLGEYWLLKLLYHLGIRYLKWNIAVIHGSENL